MKSIRRVVAVLAALFAVVATPAMAAKIYVDQKLGWVQPADKVAIANPQPVQLVIDFQTDGVSNAKAIKEVKPLILAHLAKTGQIGAVSDTPVPSGALLTVRFNNIVEKGAAGKGFKAGLTFGLAATQVTDNYDIDMAMVPATGQEAIRTSLKHALIVTLGKKSDPTLGQEYKKIKEALDAMVGQATQQGVNALAKMDGFPGK